MTTNTPGPLGRSYHTEQVHYVTCPIVYTTLSYTVGKLPPGAMVIGAGVLVTTPFAGDTPQTLDMGTTADPDGFATALAITAAGLKGADELATSDDLYMAADTNVTATLSAGTAPSAGAGYVYVSYIMANRLAG
jgi:hypothetical protein